MKIRRRKWEASCSMQPDRHDGQTSMTKVKSLVAILQTRLKMKGRAHPNI
jgi:hypothetical protein